MYLIYEIFGNDSCIVIINWYNGLLYGRKM